MGWFTAATGGTQVDANTDCPAANTTYYAHYDIILTFNAGGGSWSGGTTTQTVQNTPGAAIKLPATNPTRTGYSFAGYGNPIVAPDEPKTYTAAWSAIVYSVTLSAGDNTSWGSASTKTLTASATPEAVVSYPEGVQEPIKSGYTFAGWKAEDGTTLTIGNSTYAEATGKTFQATWDAITYTVVLAAGEGTNWGTDATKTLTATATPDAAVSYPDGVSEPNKSGYTFKGWKTEDGTTLTIGTTTYAQATGKTYLAQWEAITYIVTLKSGEGTSWGDITSQSLSATATPDAAVTYPQGVSEPARTGYAFLGWKTEEGAVLTIGTTTWAEADGNVYLAQWKANTYTNTFKANGHGTFADGALEMTVESTFDTKLNLPATSALTPDSGYVFAGWYTQATDGDQVTADTDCPAQDTTYYAHWDVLLTFNAGGGSWAGGATTQTVQNTPDTTIKLPEADPTRAGYAFAGYGNPTTAPAVPTTYTATWDAVDYVVTLDAGEDTSWGNTHTRQLIASGTPDAAVDWTDTVVTPSRAGYALDGWKAADGAVLTMGTTTFEEAAGKTYIAQWKANTYTNTFDANGHGTFGESDTSTAVDTTFGNTLNLPAAGALKPSAGYVFVGWYTLQGGGDEVTADTPCPPENTTYYAHYDVIIGFDANGGEFPTGGSYQSIQNSPGETLRIPGLNPLRAGYTFEGWEGAPDITPAVPITYTAIWSAITYTVTLSAGEGTSWGANATKTLTASATPAAAVSYPEGVSEPTKLGYSFKGWKAEDGTTLTIYTTTYEEADGKTYTAEWEANTYTNTFDANGHGTFAGGTTQKTVDTTFDTKLNLPATGELTPATGYVFLGWYTQASGGDQVTEDTDCPAQDTTYFAHYDILLIFDANGGTFADSTTAKQIQNTPAATIVLPSTDPTRAGYTFKGYDNPDTAPLAPATYYAQWEANTITNTFSANGHGTFGASATQTTVATTFGNTLNLPAADALIPETGYVFVGWYTQASGGDQVTDQTDCPPVDTTYYAHYDIILTFLAGEGAWADGTTSKEVQNTPDATIVLPATEPTRTGYTFKGYSNPDTAPAAPVTYTATWEANTYTNTFDANGHGTFTGGTTQKTVDTTFDTKLNLPATGELTPATGYVFLGWYTAASGGDQVTEDTDCPAQDITYFAHYDIILTFSAGEGAWADGDTVKTVQNTPNTAIKLPAQDPVREGYSFTGYNTPAIAPDTPKTYTATWDANPITNTFAANGHGTFAEGATHTTVATTFGNKLNLPAADALTPEDGYVFVGWYTQASGGEQVTDQTDCPPVDTTYYAHYDIILTFLAGEGAFPDGAISKEVQNTPGTAIKLPGTDPTRAGYDFAGYGEPVTAPPAPATYTAIWEPATISNIFDANGHGTFAAGATQTTVDTTFESKLNLPAAGAITPETGYVFAGWYTEASGGDRVTDQTDCPTTSTTYYAHYNVILTFTAAGGAWEGGATSKEVENIPGASIQVPSTEPTRRGYTFAGYNTPATVPADPETYAAQWTAIEYVLTLEAGEDTSWSGDGAKTISASTTPDAPVVYPQGVTEPERAGYSFKGWIAADGTVLTIGTTTYGEATGKTYNAQWEANTISNTFDANGHGTFAGGATQATVNTVFGNTLNLPAADALTPAAGYVFLGWFTDPVAGEEVTDQSACPPVNTTYYAHWEALAAWAAIESGTLKLFWGQKPASALTFAVSGPYSEQNPAPWQAYAQDIHTVDIDASLKDSPFAPASYASYLEGLSSLTQVVGLSNLNMQNAISLERMFAGCSNLEVVDLSGFNTEHVTNMDNMFLGCTAADELVLSKDTQLLPGTGLVGLDSSTNPFWISSITHAVSYGTDDATSVANINALLAALPEGATQTLRLATMRLTYEANGGTFPAQSANTHAESAAGNASTVGDGTAEEAYLYGNPGEEIDASATGGPNYTPIPVRAGYEYLGYAETPDATTPDTPVVFPEATSNFLSALSGAGDTNTTFYAVWKAVGPGPTPPTPGPDTDGGGSDIFPLTGDTTNALTSYILCILAGGVALVVARIVRRQRSR